MVAGGAPVIPMPPVAAPITSSLPNGFAVQPVTHRLVHVERRLPHTATYISPLLSIAPSPPGVANASQVLTYNQGHSSSTTPTASPPPVNCNVIPTNSVFVPTNFIPINALGPSQVLSNQTATSISNAIPSCPTIYNCNPAMPSPALVPCPQGMVNGGSVFHYASGVCAAVYPAGTVEVCPVPSTSIIPSSPGMYSLNPSISISEKLKVAAAAAWKQSYGMEQVWQCQFQQLFEQYSPHVWMLLPVNQQPNGVWHTNVDSAKVRFCCEGCGHGWTSMKGRVAFWFILNPATTEGVVCLKLYGQQCDRCKTGNYEPAMWYPEEVTKVMVNIYNKVGQVYYGFTQAPYHKTRRPGKPRTPHNSDLCQACKDGVCAERR